MSIVVVGLNHQSAPLELLERLAVNAHELPKSLHDLADRPHVAEAVLLSTCNRTEVYARCTKFHPGVQDLVDFLAVQGGCDPEALVPALYTYHDDAAVAHLFAVSAGLDSMILGESEVLGQVRDAWLLAEREGTVHHTLGRAFRHAVEVGKRVRTQTAIGRGPVSMSSTAAAVAVDHLGPLAGSSVLVVGAGVMGEGIAHALTAAGAAEIVVANRSPERAQDLAERIGGRAVGLDELTAVLGRVDVAVTSTGSSSVLLTADDVAAAMTGRPGRPLLLIDIALPRDVDPAAAGVPGVTVVDLSRLEAHAEHVIVERRRELPAAREIIGEELARYRDDCTALDAAPLVVALRDWAENLRQDEVARFGGRLQELDEREREAVEALTRGIVNKLLHGPTVRLRTAEANEHEAYRELLASFFGL
jgi:glutamyl-tRNA reductase